MSAQSNPLPLQLVLHVLTLTNPTQNTWQENYPVNRQPSKTLFGVHSQLTGGGGGLTLTYIQGHLPIPPRQMASWALPAWATSSPGHTAVERVGLPRAFGRGGHPEMEDD